MAMIRLIGGPVEVVLDDDNMNAEEIAKIAFEHFNAIFVKFAGVLQESAMDMTGGKEGKESAMFG